MTTAHVITAMEEDTFDYVICGGGTSGCVLAARLAESADVRIALIEAGPDHAELESLHMAGTWYENFGQPQTDWNIQSEPTPGLDNRQIPCTRGKFLGGSSGLNTTLLVRGTPADYDSWKLPGWSAKEMFGYMRNSETFHPDSSVFEHVENAHGYDGPLKTAPHTMQGISGKVQSSMEQAGLVYDADMFTTGSRSHGCGHVVRSIFEGKRTTAADFVTAGRRRENITIVLETLVDRIEFEREDGELKATGVKVLSKDGTSKVFKAKKEVILSAGAYCSPAILLRSGIGPESEVEAHGIQSLIDLPGVGKNLQDHPLSAIWYELSEPGLTNDHLIYHGNFPETIPALKKQYRESKTGPFSSIPFGIFAFARLDSRLADCPAWQAALRECEGELDPMGQLPSQPHVEFFNTEQYGLGTDFPTDGRSAFAMVMLLMNPRSRGSVTLRNRDPLENPVVDHKWMSDELDVLVMSEAHRFANEIVTKGDATKEVLRGSWPTEKTHHQFETREQWIPHLKRTTQTCYHPGGTCKMGQSNDPMAVLDEKLRVRGMKSLRVADVSVMPLINNGHTQMPAYAIGEKAADLINGSL